MITISNERLEEIAEEDNGSDVFFESSVLARELLALRKEREAAVPVAWTDAEDTREKFEVWAEDSGALPWGYLKKQRNGSGNYSVQIYTYMWHAWNACHEAMLAEFTTN